MSTTSYDSVYGFQPSRLTIGSGATLATWVTNVAGQNSLTLKYISGGTLEIIGATSINGVQTTIALTDLAALSGNGYLIAANESLSFDGAPRFYLSATGATTIVQILRGMGQGF